MQVAIMQPYLFPYIGYFQLLYAVDIFTVYDDVQYIKNGWINRNNFLVNEAPHLYTFSVKNDSTFNNINEREFSDKYDHEKMKFLKFLYGNYKSAPFFEATYGLVEKILAYGEKNVALKVGYSIEQICRYIGIDTQLIFSSSLECCPASTLQGQDRVIAICEALKGEHYINPIGGQHLYYASVFNSRGIRLSFLRTKPLTYKQFRNSFVPNLSIIDVLMFNSIEEIHTLLTEFDLVPE